MSMVTALIIGDMMSDWFSGILGRIWVKRQGPMSGLHRTRPLSVTSQVARKAAAVLEVRLGCF